MDNGKKSRRSAKLEGFFAITGESSESHLRGIIRILLVAMLITATLAFGAVEYWSIGLLSILAALIFLAWIAEAYVTEKISFSTETLQLPLIGLIAIGFIQLLPLSFRSVSVEVLPIAVSRSLSLDAYATRFGLIQLSVLTIFFAASLIVIDTRERLRKMALFVIVFGGLMAFFGTLQRLSNLEGIFGIRPTPQAIPFASFVNQHHFAAFMEMTLGLTLGLLFGKSAQKENRLLLSIAAVLMGIAALITGSRGGMLSLLGVVAFVVAVNLIRSKAREEDDEELELSSLRKNLLLIGGAAALLLVLIGSVLLLGGDQELLRGIGLTSSDDISSGRLHFWKTTLQIFFHNPILGVGLNAFATAYPQYDSWNGNLRVENAHNDYLQVLAEMGVVGFVAIVGFIFLLFKSGVTTIGHTADRLRRDVAIGSLAGCFGILIHSFFDFPLRTTSNALFFLLLCAFAVRKRLGRTAL